MVTVSEYKQALMSNPAVREEVETSHESSDDTLRDFCDGYFFKEHPVFKKHPTALQILFTMTTLKSPMLWGQKQGFTN